jgi:Domain of unknown function (DUF1839)
LSATSTGLVSLFGLDPAAYRPHPLHGAERAYRETNCWTDVLIELLHARGDEPLAVMGSVVRMDFEGDQWTFFKPTPADLERLLGVDVHEMQPYRDLPEQIEEQLGLGRSVMVELDSWYLPDTAATSYRAAHVKTGVAVEAINRAGERLRYFHATSLFELEDEDYRGAFRLGRAFSDDVLPPYVELVRFDAGPRLRGEELRAAAREVTRGQLSHRPADNPFARFGVRLAQDLPELLEGDAARYHDYAFATVRMAGSTFEVLATHATWLLGEEGAAAAAAFERVVDGCKVLSFKLARRRAFDPEPAVEGLATAWAEGMAALESVV